MKLHLDIRAKDQATDKTSVQKAKVLHVLSTLTPVAQSLTQCFDPVDAMRNVIMDTYSGSVHETEFMGSMYIWVFNFDTGEWERVCIDSAAFEIDFGDSEVVAVRIWEGGPYSVP